MIWVVDVEGCFYIFSCPYKQKIKFALNLLHTGSKDWLNLATKEFSRVEKDAMSWEQYTDMFRTKYVPQFEREHLAQEYLSLKQTMESVIEIIKNVY